MSQIAKGGIVRSISGRDAGRLYFVLQTQSDRVLIADGQLRRLEKPKQKNVKHLEFVSDGRSTRVYAKIMEGARLENAELRKALNLFSTEEVL